jgi:hypothetical protein
MNAQIVKAVRQLRRASKEAQVSITVKDANILLQSTVTKLHCSG